MNNRKISIIYYIASACFYIAAIISFLSHNTTQGVVMLCLGSSQLCLGAVYLNKSRKDENDKNDKGEE